VEAREVVPAQGLSLGDDDGRDLGRPRRALDEEREPADRVRPLDRGQRLEQGRTLFADEAPEVTSFVHGARID
jgi:hypothetical protein